MIGLSTRTYDLDGAVLLNENPTASNMDSIGRRVVRQQTLDGGAYFADSGYSASDRTFTVVLTAPSLELQEQLEYITQNYSLLFITCRHGAYLGGISRIAQRRGQLTLTILVSEEA